MRNKVLCSIMTISAMAGALWAQSGEPLPISRIFLYKNGMAYIVRAGEISRPIDLTFHPDDMNDVLKTFTAWNPNSGALYSLGYTTGIPARQLLGRYPFDLTGRETNLAEFLQQVKGAEAAVETASRGTLTGKLLAVNAAQRPAGGDTVVADHQITILTGDGKAVTEWLSSAVSLSLADEQLQRQLQRYLEILADGTQDVRKAVSIYPVPQSGPIRASYLQQFPVWKTSYRLQFTEDPNQGTMEGWAQIDNPTGESWDDIELTLISGMPVSFVMDLYQPLYADRSEVQVPGADVAAPRQYQTAVRRNTAASKAGYRHSPNSISGTVKDSSGGVIPGATVSVRHISTGMTRNTTTNDSGRFEIDRLQAGRYVVSVSMEGFTTFRETVRLSLGGAVELEPVLRVGEISEQMTITSRMEPRARQAMEMAGASPTAPPPFEEAPSGEFQQAEGQQLQDYFEYKFPFPVRLQGRQSAFLPFLRKAVSAERLSIFNAVQDSTNPRNGVRLKNDSGVPLEAGPVTFFEQGRYTGEAVLEYMPREDSRLLSYGVDFEIVLSRDLESGRERITGVKVSDGVATLFREQVVTSEYLIRNKSTRDKTLILEHPRNPSRELRDLDPAETTRDFHRFEIDLAAGGEEDFPVAEVVSRTRRLALLNADERAVQVFFDGYDVPDALQRQLDEIIALRRQIGEKERQLNGVEQRIERTSSDQARRRQNLEALGKSDAEKDLRQRMARELAQGEDEIARLRDQQEELQREIERLRDQLAERVSSLDFEAR